MTLDAIKCSLLSFFFPLVVVGSTLANTDAISLQPKPHAQSFVRVKTIVEVAGSLNVEKGTTSDSKKPGDRKDLAEKNNQVSIPMEVKAELFFDEKGVEGSHSPAVRHYWEAKANFVINEKTEDRQLRDDRRLIYLSDNRFANRYWSPQGSLSREELDLLEVPSAAFPPELLLPKSSVQVDEEWEINLPLAAKFFRVDEVTEGSLTGKVKEITDKQVKMELSGELKGKTDGADTKIEIKGNLHFDRQQKFISWVAFAMRENREIGFAAPGFEVVARIRTARQKIDTSTALPKVEAKAKTPTAGDLLVEHIAKNQLYQAALDRRWHSIKQNVQASVFRLVDDGDLIATCKIDRLNRMPAGKQITLSGFQSDVQAALGKNCQQILSAGEEANQQGIRLLRVVAAGEVEKTPIRWIYYHLSNDAGQRLSMIFTHESSMESRLAGADQSLASTILMTQPEDTQKNVANASVEIAR